MSVEYFITWLRRTGWGKRLVITVFIVLTCLNPAVYAAAAGVLVPFPDKGEDRARHKRPLMPENMTFPGTISPSPVVPVQVHPIYPNDGAIFPPGAAVTVSWRMPDDIALPPAVRRKPKYFRVEMTSHTHPMTTTVKFFPYHSKESTYHGIFNTRVS